MAPVGVCMSHEHACVSQPTHMAVRVLTCTLGGDEMNGKVWLVNPLLHQIRITYLEITFHKIWVFFFILHLQL